MAISFPPRDRCNYEKVPLCASSRLADKAEVPSLLDRG